MSSEFLHEQPDPTTETDRPASFHYDHNPAASPSDPDDQAPQVTSSTSSQSPPPSSTSPTNDRPGGEQVGTTPKKPKKIVPPGAPKIGENQPVGSPKSNATIASEYSSPQAASPQTGSSAPAQGSEKRLSFSGSLKAAFSTIDPLARNVSKELNKSFHQALQLAGEKLGTAEITPLPQEYLELETRMDELRNLQENLIRVVANQISPGAATDLKLSVYGTLNTLVDTVGPTSDSPLNAMVEKLKAITVNPNPANQVLADEFTVASNSLGQTSQGTAFSKAAEVQRKIGKARVQMNSELIEKFIKKLSVNLETTFRKVNMYRRTVYSSRVKLDALKTRVKSLSPEKAEALAEELQDAQKDFNATVATTVELMKSAVDNTEPLVALVDLMNSMFTYFQTGYDLLSSLAPELEVIKENALAGKAEETKSQDPEEGTEAGFH